MNNEKEALFRVAEEIASAIARVLDEHDELSVGAQLFALRTSLISILHYYSHFDVGGGIDFFFDSLREQYHKTHAALQQMENAEKGKFN